MPENIAGTIFFNMCLYCLHIALKVFKGIKTKLFHGDF